MFRVAPQAVCRQLLAETRHIKPLSHEEQVALMQAIENTDIPNGVDRLLADLTRGTITLLLDRI